MIDVLPGTDRRLTDLYIDLPFRLYRHDPLWVPPLRADIRKLMSPKKNPLFAEAAIEHFVAFNEAGVVVVGRISATIHHDYNSRFGEQHVFFGYFRWQTANSAADLQPALLPHSSGASRTLVSFYLQHLWHSQPTERTHRAFAKAR
ncbi:hypothetical protein [Verminephrobacter eiseniae]|uniref:hypothetical protein n=1 Tax=Verminephrobacter eiseniae TaxID=364317 RepID=UPI0010DF7AF3|nr:hypothetical protein [Verminephrobacter eiseniae]KAB7630701.1 hypothetical protein ET532_002070 [Verminephrobacter sp. Larva24]MCW5231432.1 hypothetical protein [Verminephrobacter eiseniae]MCW5293163.1 hypothetical protein [Verminephrobacter eiseniae]MCW8185193.1 hypothetical protein [Verminephrobacter eiseniae]MCW8223847.1 hypothetical protein [Verminephrobacter eiseniae]